MNLVNPERNFTKTCSAPTAPDAGRPDVERIAVTDPALLDAVCALGLGAKVTAVTSAPAQCPPISARNCRVPAIGVSPLQMLASKARPDVADYAVDGRFSSYFPGRAPTSIESWPAGRPDSPPSPLRCTAHRRPRRCCAPSTPTPRRSARLNAAQTQVSLVRFGPDSETIAGTDSFAGQILGIVGVQRPQRQRQPGTIKVTDDNFTSADADHHLHQLFRTRGASSTASRSSSATAGSTWGHRREARARRRRRGLVPHLRTGRRAPGPQRSEVLAQRQFCRVLSMRRRSCRRL